LKTIFLAFSASFLYPISAGELHGGSSPRRTRNISRFLAISDSFCLLTESKWRKRVILSRTKKSWRNA